MNNKNILSSSFRDPSGFVFFNNDILFRQVNKCYKEDYDFLMTSGLYEALVKKGMLISHEEVSLDYKKNDEAYKVLKPERIPFISYPYEWTFSQLKDAALITLEIQKIALDHGMTLKDSSAYNIQFYNGKPIFIDTLSFEKYLDGSPWSAYKQFCQHFLAPLALMSYKDVKLNQLLRIYIDGIPLELACSLLPRRTLFKPSLLTHLHLHAKSQEHFADKGSSNGKLCKVSRLGLTAIIDNLITVVKKLKWEPSGTEWADYYQNTNYSDEAFEHKMKLVEKFIEITKPKIVWDLGANIGIFSRIASQKKIQTISFDIDSSAVEKNYLQSIKAGETNILPLILDLTNPSSGIGWDNNERMSIKERGPADTVLALALIHHLAISNNVPLVRIAQFFRDVCYHLIIEFVPKNDSQVQRLLATRKDIFSDYTQTNFEIEFSNFFNIVESVKVRNSERTIYLMKKR